MPLIYHLSPIICKYIFRQLDMQCIFFFIESIFLYFNIILKIVIFAIKYLLSINHVLED